MVTYKNKLCLLTMLIVSSCGFGGGQIGVFAKSLDERQHLAIFDVELVDLEGTISADDHEKWRRMEADLDHVLAGDDNLVFCSLVPGTIRMYEPPSRSVHALIHCTRPIPFEQEVNKSTHPYMYKYAF
ncbi:MAG: hypothetical protein V3U65_01840 [Granulosicoccaceae bacterium]